MIELCFNLKGNYLPYQLSFKDTLAHVSALLVGLPYSTTGAIPRQLKGVHNMAESLILEGRRERAFPRAVKPRPQRYAKNKKCCSLKSEQHWGIDRFFDQNNRNKSRRELKSEQLFADFINDIKDMDL